MRTSIVTMVAVLALPGASGAQNTISPTNGASVRLEPHNGQTQFRLGDPVTVDLVFYGGSASDAVVTSVNPYLPVPDEVDLEPLDGWLRAHTARPGQGLSEMPEHFSGAPIRVPILLNRDVTVLYPTHYEVRVTTTRLLTQTPTGLAPGRCDPCTTNALGLDIVAQRVPADEAALVAKVSQRLEDINRELVNDRKTPLKDRMSAEHREEFEHQIEASKKIDPSTPEGKARGEALLRQLAAPVNADFAHQDELEAERREGAQKLAYLIGDDAIRAKVRLIAEDPEDGSDATPISPILLDGLPSSFNKQLQLDLLEEAWQDPRRVPTGILQNALREAKELMHSSMPTPQGLVWAGGEDESQAALAENRREIDEIEATLDLRTPANRAATLAWLKAQGAPNQFNHRRAALAEQ